MDYSEMSVDPSDLGIDLDVSALAPIPEDGPAPSAQDHGVQRDSRYEARQDPLVDAGRDLLCVNCYDRAGWPGTSPTTWLRRGVVTRLVDGVQLDLPDGFTVAIFDGWRSPTTVGALYEHFYGAGSTLEPGYLAPPVDDPADPPPHLTGGAVDATLAWNGVPLSLGTPFDEFTPRAHLTSLEHVADDHPDALARDLRRLLYDAMITSGFAPYPQEWWHFSYGDRGWARWHGVPDVLYGGTAPSR